VLELDFDRVIPGHGPATDREALRAFQAFMRQLAEVGQQAAQEGWSLEETQERAVVDTDRGFEVVSIPFLFRNDRAFVVRRAWEEATNKVERIALPEAVK
jgi:glyoxylase-like metal-dependent hydrolase (beta-lactamase superfamily II)